MTVSSLLIRQRPFETLELSGLWWRITQPPSSVGTRLYRQVIAFAGPQVLESVVLAMQAPEAEAEAEAKAQLWGADEAIRILRGAQAGAPVVAADLVSLQLALAPLVELASLDKINDLGRDLLWESELMASRAPKVFTGPDTFGADRVDRADWERTLDAIIPDVATRTKLEVWAFLLLCRPSSAGSRIAR